MVEFVGGHNKRPMRCELRFHGETAGWEAQFLDDDGLFYSRSTFPTRALANAWAAAERQDLERRDG